MAQEHRDELIDFCHAFDFFVVLRHWVFTIVIWNDERPVATDPIGSTHGFGPLSWLFEPSPPETPALGMDHETVNRCALLLYLFSTGFAVTLAVVTGLGSRLADTPTLEWWLKRPIRHRHPGPAAGDF